jgi:hypothetical protein
VAANLGSDQDLGVIDPVEDVRELAALTLVEVRGLAVAGRE